MKDDMTPIPERIDNRPLTPAYSEDGVDLTLIRWMLSLTPDQRLDLNQRNARAIWEMRQYAKRSTTD